MGSPSRPPKSSPMEVSAEPTSLNIEHVRAVYGCPNQLRLPKSSP